MADISTVSKIIDNEFRVTMDRKNRYVKAAKRRKLKLSEWMTETCDTASDG